MDSVAGSSGSLEEALQLRFKDRGRPFVPEDVIRPADLLFLKHLCCKNGINGGVVEAVALAQPLAACRVAGSDQEISFLTKIEAVLEQKRDVRNEQGRPQFAGGSQRFKTFLANPRVQNGFQVFPRGRVTEYPAAKGGPVHSPVLIQNPVPESIGNGSRSLPVSRQERVHAGIGVENHGIRLQPGNRPAGRGFPAGNAAAEAEDTHGCT